MQPLVLPSDRITAREQFGVLLNDLRLTGEAIEIGTYVGDFAIPLLSTWHGRLLHVIDPWESYAGYEKDCLFNENLPEKYKVFCEKIARFKHRVKIHKAMSQDIAGRFADNSMDFIYIDGNHEYSFAKKDLHLYWPKVKPGGIFAGHDFDAGSWADDCRKAVLEFFAELHLPIFFVPGDAYSWYVHKPIVRTVEMAPAALGV